jgi:hypothetical protein
MQKIMKQMGIMGGKSKKKGRGGGLGGMMDMFRGMGN